eukprot:jgi/Chlat1/5994/Chrsp4S06311
MSRLASHAAASVLTGGHRENDNGTTIADFTACRWRHNSLAVSRKDALSSAGMVSCGREFKDRRAALRCCAFGSTSSSRADASNAHSPRAETSGGSSSNGTKVESFAKADVTPEALWQELLPHISYLTPAQQSLVHDGLQLAYHAHHGQRRRSGEPYIIHPVAVAIILGDLGMDYETILAGLLHDTVEDTCTVTFERIEQQFGNVVRRIVEGETKVSKLGKVQRGESTTVVRDVKADDLQQMFIAMTEEVRVIIVKLADRLHNMRTLEHMPREKQKCIAEETLQVFAPLARLLGVYRIKSELEELSFRYSDPETYSLLVRHLDKLCTQQGDVVLQARHILEETFDRDSFLKLTTTRATVTALCKDVYSLKKKVLERGGSIQDIRDVAQLRIVLKMAPQGEGADQTRNVTQVCYHVLGIIHAMWRPVPGTVKDYIATPKPNGYQSLHTTVLPLGTSALVPLEIQIRTEEMHRLAECGIAAQRGPNGWGLGAGGGNGTPIDKEDIARRASWLNSIREWQDEFVGNMSAREFVDTITGELLGRRVFVFTPQGEVVTLPTGATVVDYAYHIHSDIGDRMVAAKVNGSIVAPSHALKNAEVVEIITYAGSVNSSKIYKLHQQWLKYARTRSARHKLTKFLKDQARASRAAFTSEAIQSFTQMDVEKLNTRDTSSNGNGNGASATTSTPQPSTSSNGADTPALNGRLTPVGSSYSNGKVYNGSEPQPMKLARSSESTAAFQWQLQTLITWQAGKQNFMWLSVECKDRNGLLTDVSAVLSSNDVSITSYSGRGDKSSGIGWMLFEVDGSHENLQRVCEEIVTVPDVLSWATGCSWRPSLEELPETPTFM